MSIGMLDVVNFTAPITGLVKRVQTLKPALFNCEVSAVFALLCF